MSTKSWSKYQEAVFADAATGSGHTVVEAFAGSGKTTTLMESLRHIPGALTALMVAFNKSIAVELEKRIREMRGLKAAVEAKTLHAFGLRTCSRKYGQVRIDDARGHALVRAFVEGGAETADLRAALAKAVSLSKCCLARHAHQVDEMMDTFGIDPGEPEAGGMDRAEFIETVLQVLKAAQNPFQQAQMKSAKQRDERWSLYQSKEAAIDFDDMIWIPVQNELRVWQFDRVIIDERQDLNACQIQLALRACKKGGRILAVGDERQAIYGFRGADSGSMKLMVETLGAKVLPLSITYRCPKSVVRLAQTIVPEIEWAPEAEEGSVSEIGEKEMLKLVKEGDFILSRTNAPLMPLCLQLLREGRRANVLGKDVGAQIVSFVKKSKCRTIEALREYADAWCEKECARLAKKDPPADTTRVEDMRDTILALSEPCVSIDDMLVSLDTLFSDKDPEKKIILATTHKAKGLERENVFLLRDTYMRRRKGQEAPSREEENLFYVAVTRSKKNLYLVRDAKNAGGEGGKEGGES
jgi:DNA helicase-2/ATP-dependent DNA helicase PcrA